MLSSRLRFRRNVRVFARFLADKPSDNDPKVVGNEIKAGKEKKLESSTEKIQNLLKSMMTEPKIIESEYKDKVVTAPRRSKQQRVDVQVKTEKIEDSITKAASEVAQALGGDVKQTESELLSKVLGKINQSSTSLSDLIIGMKVDRSRDSEEVMPRETRGQQVKRIVNQAKPQPQRMTAPQGQKSFNQVQRKSVTPPMTVDIFGGPVLDIFKKTEPNYGTKLDVWDNLQERELTLATSQPPANYFQKMILWTEQGKVWKFPLDNEQGIEEEQNVHFSEHIFLENHIEDWCPKKGPIRHFMELVCVGLSKNAFYTVQEKRDHIAWYREYFESKKSLLNEIGVWDNVKPTSSEVSA